MYRSLITAILLIGSLASVSGSSPQDPPAPKHQVHLKSALVVTSADVWAEVREVDPTFKALEGEVARLVKGLNSDSIEDRNKATAALKAAGLCAYGAIKAARESASSPQVRLELDAVLKDMAGDLPTTLATVPAARKLGKKEGEALRTRMTAKKITPVHEPSLAMFDGQPATVFIGEEAPPGPGRKRLRLDPDDKKIRIEEKRATLGLKYGLQMLITPKVLDADRRTASLAISITSTTIRQPIREIITPLGAVSDPEVIEIGVDLTAVVESGQLYVAGPFPSGDEKGIPWWILVECQVIKP